MEKLPQRVNSIVCDSTIFVSEGRRHIGYTINETLGTRMDVQVVLPRAWRPEKSDKIVDDSNQYAHGFKVVRTINGEYAYVRESDQLLLPFQYDVAFDFNELGFAIVGKDGTVSWINTDFKHLNPEGEMTEESESSCAKFDGWQGITNFSKGEIPLSRVYEGRTNSEKYVYFGADGKLKKFYQYNGSNGKINSHFSRTVFLSGSQFDESGRAVTCGSMLFAKGYFASYYDLVKLAIEKGFLDSICLEAEEYFDKESEKVLKKDR